jgi:hypothetical protein
MLITEAVGVASSKTKKQDVVVLLLLPSWR